MWQARNSTNPTPTATTTNSKPTEDALKAKGAAIRQRHKALRERLIH